MAYAERLLNDKGRKIVVGINFGRWHCSNATVMSWRSMEGGIEAAKLHHDVMWRQTRTYILIIIKVLTLNWNLMPLVDTVRSEKVYQWDPLPASHQRRTETHPWCAGQCGPNTSLHLNMLYNTWCYHVWRRFAKCNGRNPNKKTTLIFLKRIPILSGFINWTIITMRPFIWCFGWFHIKSKDRSVDVKLLTLDKALFIIRLMAANPHHRRLFILIF